MEANFGLELKFVEPLTETFPTEIYTASEDVFSSSR